MTPIISAAPISRGVRLPPHAELKVLYHCVQSVGHCELKSEVNQFEQSGAVAGVAGLVMIPSAAMAAAIAAAVCA